VRQYRETTTLSTVTFDASDITIAILTGRRPHLLKRTWSALPTYLVDTAHVVVFHNGGDDETAEVLNDRRVDLKLTNLDGLWPIGQATSELLQLAKLERRPFTLYLQDDWECRNDDSWLTTAVQILDSDPTIGTVRLRLVEEPTWVNTMSLDRRVVRWVSYGDYRVSINAQFCLNPFIVRSEDLLTDIRDERDAAHQYFLTGKKVAQLTPGVFAHIGGKGESLRIRADNARRHGTPL
jgi:hypothetical protein